MRVPQQSAASEAAAVGGSALQAALHLARAASTPCLSSLVTCASAQQASGAKRKCFVRLHDAGLRVELRYVKSASLIGLQATATL